MPQPIDAEQVVVCGAGYTGQAIARALCRMGKRVTVTDSRPAAQLTGAARVLDDLGVPLHCGEHAVEIVCAADLVVISPGVPYHTTPALIEARRRGLPVWGEVEFAARLTDAKLVGVTGTKGKTTTATLASQMLDAPLANAEAFSAKGVPLIELASDRPDMPLVVAEMSSYQLESVDRLRPWVAALLNLGQDHVDRHPSRAEYLAAKANIFKNQQADDRSVYGWDVADVRAVGEALETLRAPFSLREPLATGVWASEDGIEVELPLIGFSGRLINWADVHPGLQLQRPSLIAACACALMAEAEVEAVRRVAAEFPGLPHRMEHVRVWRDITFINDSKGTNPLATENAIRLSPRPVVLIAGGDTKHLDLTPLTEPFRGLRALVLIGQDAPALEAVAAAAGVPVVRRAGTLQQAVEKAAELARAGDWVIFSPSAASFDMFNDFADRGEQYKTFVHEL